MNHFSYAASQIVSNLSLEAPGTIASGVAYHLRYRPAIAVTSFDYLPMVDWDWPKTKEASGPSNFNEVVDLVLNYLDTHKQHIRLYLTPSGMHAFFLAEQLTPHDFDATESLQGDLLYAKLSRERNDFSVRVTPKDRPLDFVAVYALTLANCDANPELEQMLNTHHDKRIAEYFERNRTPRSAKALAYGRVVLGKALGKSQE